MGIHRPEIIELLLLVEQKYSKNLRTTTDFEEFSFHLQCRLGESISPSTLKRLWGYVNDNHVPRTTTLDLLSRYVDHSNFNTFLQDLKCRSASNSSFVNTKQLHAYSLVAGDEIEIGWAPNRYIRLLYQGMQRFRVLESLQSKLQPEDTFEVASFIQGQPLVISGIFRNGQKTPPFIAGRNGGLTLINTIKHG